MKESVENKLNNIHELEFTLFCIESLAEAIGWSKCLSRT